MSHTLITVAAVIAAFTIGWHTEAAIIMAGFWLGREHAQAEYRWMALHKANRSRMPWQAGFTPESWTKKSLFTDMITPIAVGTLLAWAVT